MSYKCNKYNSLNKFNIRSLLAWYKYSMSLKDKLQTIKIVDREPRKYNVVQRSTGYVSAAKSAVRIIRITSRI